MGKWVKFIIYIMINIILFGFMFVFWSSQFDNINNSNTMLMLFITPTCALLAFVIDYFYRWYKAIK